MKTLRKIGQIMAKIGSKIGVTTPS